MPAFEIERRGRTYEVEAPDQARALAVLRSYEPSLFERIGNATYDALNALGLPASRMRRDMTSLDHAVRGAADTMTFGTADEIAARANALLGKDYETNLERQRAIDRTGGDARLAGQIAGGVLGGVGFARSGISTAANAVGARKAFLPTVGYSALEGAALAAAYGFGSGEAGVEHRVREALRAAPIGAAVGLAAGIILTARDSVARSRRWLDEINERRFYRRSDGSTVLGHMPPGVERASDGRIPQGPVKMELGKPGKDGYGAFHISDDKHQRARELGYRNAFELIEDVAEGRTTIVEQTNGRSMLVKEPGKDQAYRYIITEFQPGSLLDRLLRREPFHGVTTGFPESKRKVGKPSKTNLQRTLNKAGNKKIWEGEP